MQTYEIKEETVNTVLKYLTRCPYEDVQHLVNLLMEVGNNPIVEEEVKFNGKNSGKERVPTGKREKAT
jgi:hypothetical protein